ncbi:Grx4 family monothiol glutaredoxin [Emergomyces pasteurianus Ep9510]|uniref:Grx4 family monothiol glutaredoxin n=1 Tax=Emergomyces pasteurianus Ep9510 TaxID=1447872 RepID=A0A1J9P2I7_9EURO|nr:Grx4 family monothiol glutaredoxin [Emergomyces pasteurianus Ep9510]
MSTLNEIASDEAFNNHLSSLPSSTLLVLYFHTPWAAPCTQMRTVLSTLASTYPATTPPAISFVSVNAEELPDISEQYDVTAVPFIILIRDGKVLQSLSGSDAVKARAAIEQHAGVAATGNATGAEKQSIPPPLHAEPRKDISASGTSNTPDATNGAAATPSDATPPPNKQELFARLEELVKAAPVMLFMKGTPSAPQCGFSRQLVGILRENGVKYGFFNILADEDVRQGLKEYADWPTFPQLWVKGELVGGLDIVKEEISANPDFFKDYSVAR